VAFPDTITITVNAVPKILVALKSGNPLESKYLLRGTTDQYELRIAHKTYKDSSRAGITVNRHTAEFIQTIYPIAPNSIPIVRKSYIVYEETPNDVVADVQKFDEAFVAFNSAANITKMLNYE
jgi:transcriptional regulator